MSLQFVVLMCQVNDFEMVRPRVPMQIMAHLHFFTTRDVVANALCHCTTTVSCSLLAPLVDHFHYLYPGY